MFKTKTWYFLELLTPETMTLLEGTKRKITKDKNVQNVSYLDITEVLLIHCHVVNNSCQQNSWVLYTFVSNKLFGQLLGILLENFIFSRTFDLEFSTVEVWLPDWNSNSLEKEDNINITLVIT